MIIGMLEYPVNKLKEIPTPYYLYDTQLLHETLQLVKKESERYGYFIHYAVKANANERIMKIIRDYGFGADCVSGNEIQRAVDTGYNPEHIVFAGVGKSDAEIEKALDLDIFCFNCESIPEIEVINELAAKQNKKARIALRINPNIDAHTHHFITTGLEENKFGINRGDLDTVLDKLKNFRNLELAGLHFHIGSQITDLNAYKGLCVRVNEIQEWFFSRRVIVEHINVGGGFGVDYEHPDINRIPDFASFFKLFKRFLELRPTQTLHFEPGRSVVAQCGALITKVLYIKQAVKTKFAIVDAGMTELIRPALYNSYHKIENLSRSNGADFYDVVGPVCESSDYFGKLVSLPETQRGDLLAIRSTGAYGQIMASGYNLRNPVKDYYTEDIFEK